MTRLFLASIAVVSALAVVPYAREAQKPPQVTAKASDKKGELAALKQKLVGTWIGTGPCDGNMVFQADGTYRVTDWMVGGISGSGTWKIQWSELPPTLVLSHPWRDTWLDIELGDDAKKPINVHLLTLNDKALHFRYPEPNGSPAGTHERGTDADGMRIRLAILNRGVQRYLGINHKLPPNLKALLDEKILRPESLVDPWGKEFQYDVTGKKTKNKEVPDIWTETPDKKIIGNWPTTNKAPKKAPLDVTRVSAKEPVSIETQYPVWEIVCSQDGMRLAITGLARQGGVGTGTIRVLDIPTAKERFHLKDQDFPPRFTFAPDGKTLAVISAVSNGQGNVHIWDVGAGKKIRTLESDTMHGGLVFSPDSKTLISLSVDQKAWGRIALWETATGKKRVDFQLPGAKKGFGFYQCALSPDGTKLAVHDTSLEIYGNGPTIQDKGSSSLGIWDTETGKELVQIKDHRFGFSDFVFSPDSLFRSDNQTLVTLGCVSRSFASPQANVQIPGAKLIDGQWHAGENSIVLRDANTGKEIRRFAEKRAEGLIFKHIALSADGKTLAGGGSDGVIYLWDVPTGKEIQQLKNHQQDLAQKDGWTFAGIVLAFTPDGRRLVSAANKRVLIWNMQEAGK